MGHRWMGNTSLASHVMKLMSTVYLEDQLPLTPPSIAMLGKILAGARCNSYCSFLVVPQMNSAANTFVFQNCFISNLWSSSIAAVLGSKDDRNIKLIFVAPKNVKSLGFVGDMLQNAIPAHSDSNDFAVLFVVNIK